MDFGILILIFLIAIIFFLDGFKIGSQWLIFGIITVLLVSFAYYVCLSLFPIYGKMIFASILILLTIILAYMRTKL